MQGTRRPLAVVTGATGGIGGALAPMLAAKGWDLALPVRDERRAEHVVEAVRAAQGDAKVNLYQADLADHRNIEQLAQKLRGDHGSIHALFNVAGYLSTEAKSSPQGNEMTFELNTLAPLILLHRLAPALVEGARDTGRAVVVNVSSNAIKLSGALDVDQLPDNPKTGIFKAYGQTKLALTIATRALAPVYAEESIELFAVDPGSNKSAMTGGAGAPFFVRWMHPLLPGPENGASRLMATLKAGTFAPGSLIVGGKAKGLPKQSASDDTLRKLMALLDDRAGVALAEPAFADQSSQIESQAQ